MLHRTLLKLLGFVAGSWRPRPELNRGKRFCRPLRNHSATWPGMSAELFKLRPEGALRIQERHRSGNGALAACRVACGRGVRRIRLTLSAARTLHFGPP